MIVSNPNAEFCSVNCVRVYTVCYSARMRRIVVFAPSLGSTDSLELTMLVEKVFEDLFEPALAPFPLF